MRIILFFVILIMGIIQLRPNLEGPDAEHYYAIGKSLSFNRDLMFQNELESTGYQMVVSPTYHIIEYHQIGAPLIWMFIFDVFKSIGITDERILKTAINLSEYLLAILALIFIFKISLKFFDPKTVFLSLLAVLFGTNLFVYSSRLAGCSHILSIFFISALLLFYFNTRKERPKIDWFILGGLSGLMLMARGDTFVYLLFPVFDLLIYLKNKKWKSALLYGSLFILGLLFTFSPQIAYWKIIFGKIFRPYGEPDFFTGNKFLEVLFSCSRGFFFFSPLLAICFLLGIFFLSRKTSHLLFLLL